VRVTTEVRGGFLLGSAKSAGLDAKSSHRNRRDGYLLIQMQPAIQKH